MGDLLLGQGPDDPGRTTQDQHPVGHHRLAGDQRASPNDAVPAHLRAAQEDGAHAHYRVVSHCAAVENRPMAHRHALAQDAGLIVINVQDSVFLNVAVFPDDDGGQIPPQHAVVPDRYPCFQRYIPRHHGPSQQNRLI